MPLQAIVYASMAVPDLSFQRVADLVLDAAAHNEVAGVTGVLLYDGNRFLQFFEGPDDAILPTYERIRRATSHSDLLELGRSSGGARRFPQWSMHWVAVSQVDLRITLCSDWRGLTQRRVEDVFQVPTGVDRLAALFPPSSE